MKMREFMAVARALGDENRVRMLRALQGGELCVCQITELFGLAASTTSKHLSILYQAGLLDSRKHGRWMYYSLPGKTAPSSSQIGETVSKTGSTFPFLRARLVSR